MAKKLLFLFISACFLSCFKNNPVPDGETTTFRHIDSLIINSRNTSFSDSLRNDYFQKAISYTDEIDHDSLKILSNFRLAYSSLALGNMDKFKSLSKKTIELSEQTNDTLNKAKGLQALGYYYQRVFQSDSAYFFYNKAFNLYKLLNIESSEGDLLLSMATVQSLEKDCLGSEINTFKALAKYKNSNTNKNLFLCYNNLAYISNLLKNYDESIAYRQEALKHLSKNANSEYYYLMTINGIGVSYQDKGDYSNSIKYFDKGLSYSKLEENHPLRYARFIDNKAYSNLQLGFEAELPDRFYKALQIRDSLQNKEGIIQSNLNLAKFYLHKRDIITAQNHALKAKDLSKEISLNSDLLESYELLAKTTPGEGGKAYLLKHIHLSDSLQQAERIIREKFTRIAYETDEIIHEKEVETRRKWWLAGFLILVAILSVLIIFSLRQRSKNKELLFNQQQEEANIEIYNLMISEQSKYQEGTNEEKKRISEELHDGVLGGLFGTRLILDSLNDGTSEKEIEERQNCIDELQIIEEDIRKISHNLNNASFGTHTNFVKMVEQLVEKQSKISKFDYEVKFNDRINWEVITNKIRIHCYRTFQEALQNINKYARASKVEIAVDEIAGKLLIEINDNGVGFDVKKKSKGIGISNIKSRVQRLGGAVEIDSSSNHGTLIKMSIPIS